MTDWSTHENALKLAKIIRVYWRSRGFVVNTSVAPVGVKTKDAAYIWTIQSDMVAGVPVQRIQ